MLILGHTGIHDSKEFVAYEIHEKEDSSGFIIFGMPDKSDGYLRLCARIATYDSREEAELELIDLYTAILENEAGHEMKPRIAYQVSDEELDDLVKEILTEPSVINSISAMYSSFSDCLAAASKRIRECLNKRDGE